MSESYDVAVIGAGPGGYVAAIKAAQHGKRVVIIEREQLGGVCLNWGCIPTKALLKSAEVLGELQNADEFGLVAKGVKHDFAKVIARSRGVAEQMAQGVAFLMKKNRITVVSGSARLLTARHLQITAADGGIRFIEAAAVIIATGAHARTFPDLPVDGSKVFHYRRAMSLAKQPKRLLCIGAGAIGMEFGWFYSALGSAVTVVEVADQVLPVEDHESAELVAKSFRKQGITVHTGTRVASLDTRGRGVTAQLQKADGSSESLSVDAVLVAVGMAPNSAGIGCEDVGVRLDERGFVIVDQHQQTSVPGVYAIGDVAGRQLLAHKASFEGEAAVAHICGGAQSVLYDQIPGCTYCQPQVASVGLTQRAAEQRGHQLKIGRFSFQASGKATAIGHREGFVKLIFDAAHDQLLGAHLVGHDATELLAELGLALKLECTAREILQTIHAHPTLSEAVMEAAADALGECVHQ